MIKNNYKGRQLENIQANALFINQVRNLTAKFYTSNGMWLIPYFNPIIKLFHNFITAEVIHNIFLMASLPCQAMFMTTYSGKIFGWPKAIAAKHFFASWQFSATCILLDGASGHEAINEIDATNLWNCAIPLRRSGIWQKFTKDNELYITASQGNFDVMHFCLVFKLGNKWNFKILAEISAWHGGE